MRIVPALPISTSSKDSDPVIRTSARSAAALRSNTSPLRDLPSDRMTSTRGVVPTTWLLVTTRPSALTMNPEPLLMPATIRTTSYRSEHEVVRMPV